MSYRRRYRRPYLHPTYRQKSWRDRPLPCLVQILIVLGTWTLCLLALVVMYWLNN
jgi:hypothetical protein